MGRGTICDEKGPGHEHVQPAEAVATPVALNDYPDPDGGDSVTPEPLPELDADFRLQFNLWQLPREARQRAFAILPCGAEMLARIDEYLSARREPLEPQ